MAFFLAAEAEPVRGLLPFLQENWLVLLPPVLGFVAIYLLLPQARRVKPIVGGALAAIALVVGAVVLIRSEAPTVEAVLFYAFAGLAIAAGVMMITQSNPVHAALSFALVVLSTCGLFLLQAAPFLMAATIIIYAGAIVVTFLFVIMLAQQEGVSNADQRSREPFLACVAGCVLLASLLCVLHKTYEPDPEGIRRRLQEVSEAKDAGEVKQLLGDFTDMKDDGPSSDFLEGLKERYRDAQTGVLINNLNQSWRGMRVNPAKNLDPLKERAKTLLAALELRRGRQGAVALTDVKGKDNTPGHFPPGKLPAGNVAAIGKTLFTDYLIPVLLAATLLLVATIGAIAIAGRRSEELR